MQYSIIPYSDIDLGNRIDAEYFQPTYLEMEERLKSLNGTPLRNFCSITGSAFYPAATHLYEIGDLPFIRCVDCIPHPIVTTRQNSSFEKIPTYFANEQKNIKTLSKGEIVITKVGSPCYASIIHDLDVVALSRTVLGLKSIHGVDPYYLVAYLRSKYGFSQLVTERELTIQYQLTLDRVGSVLIFKPENELLEQKIAQSFLLYEAAIKHSESLFHKAQSLLLSELGLANWQPKHRLNFVRNSNEVEKAERIDAEYFQPKYDEIVNAIKSYAGGWDRLGNLVVMKKSVEIGSSEYLDEGIPFVRVSNLSPFELSEEKFMSDKLYAELAKHQPQKGEILLSKDGSPGIAYHLREKPEKMIVSGGILRLKLKNQRINADYLALVLNSLLVQEQANRDIGGSIIYHWRPDQIKEVVIPIFGKEKQDEIQQKVSESFALRAKSKSLLEAAKRAVEMAIEESEEKALAWLAKQIEKSGIEL